MAVTQADLDALNAAIAGGERQVTIGNQSVTYRSVTELIAARNDLKTQLERIKATAAGKPRNRVRRLFHAGRGYN